jgi:excisionase family DNA binding protein
MLEHNDLMPPPRAAKLLGVSTRQLYRLSRDGVVPAVRVGRLLRYSRKALADFVSRGGAAWPSGRRPTPAGGSGRNTALTA